MKTILWTPVLLIFLLFKQSNAQPSAFGGGFDVQEFYEPFTLEDITHANMQKWPYYKYVSANWDDYAIHGTAQISKSKNPAKLILDDKLDMNTEFQNDKTWIESLQSTQVKGFVVMQDNHILAEYYDNGFNIDQSNLLQSASKSFTGVVIHQLIEKGLINPSQRMDYYIKDFIGTDIGKATVQQVLDMISGLPTLLDFHTPGAPGQLFEVEQGLQPGKTTGHINAIKKTEAIAAPGEEYNYSDKNTDALAFLAEVVSKRKFPELLSDLFDAFGANYNGSIAQTSDGTFSGAYGISISTRDYALFHQWIAQMKAPKSYYASFTDESKDKFSQNEVAKLLGEGIIYGSQTYYLSDLDIAYSSGSFGQLGYSDFKNGVSIVFLQDWAVNAELDKFFITRDRAISIINYLRSESLIKY
jgi:CubicO group peptidase (beta-lactamase class C family)